MGRRKGGTTDTTNPASTAHAKAPAPVQICTICPESTALSRCPHSHSGRLYQETRAKLLSRSRIIAAMNPLQPPTGPLSNTPAASSASPASSSQAYSPSPYNPYLHFNFSAPTAPTTPYGYSSYPPYGSPYTWPVSYSSSPSSLPITPPNPRAPCVPSAIPVPNSTSIHPRTALENNQASLTLLSLPSSPDPFIAPPLTTILPAEPSSNVALESGSMPICGDGPPTAPADSVDDKTSDEEETTDEDNSRPPISKKRKVSSHIASPRISGKNPKYGFVVGAMKGKIAAKIFRRKSLPGLSKDPTRRFNKQVPDIIARCERLAAETGCWLLIAGNSRSHASGVLHYVTPAMRQDALAESTAMINDFQRVTGAIKLARREDAYQLSKGLIQMEKEKQEAEDSKTEAIQALAATRKEFEVQVELIATLRAQLAGVTPSETTTTLTT
ncbi:hypothetical protein C8J57DRAFT_1498896 [Mycena rebaudengoi]|nr:hypothetical protein C8J57DRAFT_1498896 [Mycena rebaudengoi]